MPVYRYLIEGIEQNDIACFFDGSTISCAKSDDVYIGAFGCNFSIVITIPTNIDAIGNKDLFAPTVEYLHLVSVEIEVPRHGFKNVVVPTDHESIGYP